MVELIVAILILALVMTGLFRLFLYSSAYADMSGNMSRAVAAAQDKIEEMRNHTFANIVSDYAGATFDLTNPTGKGQITINSSNSGLLQVTIKISFRNQSQRVIGEDANLDGAFDAGSEDANGNGTYDTPVSLVTLISDY